MADNNKRIYQIPIEGIIGLDVTAKEIRDKLALADGGDIEFQFNTPGGFIFPGLQIYNLIKDYPGKTTGIVSLAASMGSYLLMAVDNKIVEDNGIFMIHNARGGAGGDHRDLRRAADLMEKSSSLLAKAYIEQTGMSESEIRKMMDEETFLYGQEIVNKKFANSIKKSNKKTDKQSALIMARGQFDDMQAKIKDDSEDWNRLENLTITIETDDEDEPCPECDPNNPDHTTQPGQICDKCGQKMPMNLFNDIEDSQLNKLLSDYNFLIKNTVEFNPENPYPNEHACRLVNPDKFDSFRRQNNAGKVNGKRIDFIFGIKNNKSELQAIRYPKDIWEANDAKANCKTHKGISFEAAKSTNKSENKITGENKMDLKTLLNENPEAKAQYDKDIIDAKTSGQKEIQARIEAVSPFLNNTKYAKIQGSALKALKGELNVEAFKMGITMLDMQNEQNAENAALDEQGNPVAAQQTPALSKTGNVETVADIPNVVKDLKSSLAGVI